MFTVDDIKTKWKNLRIQRRKMFIEKKARFRSDSGYFKPVKWEFYDILSFLEPHFKSREPTSGKFDDERRKRKNFVPNGVINIKTEDESETETNDLIIKKLKTNESNNLDYAKEICKQLDKLKDIPQLELKIDIQKLILEKYQIAANLKD